MVEHINHLSRKLPVWLIYLIGAAPGVYFIMLGVRNELGPEPIAKLEHLLGEFALQMLVFGLAITPLRRIFGINLFKFRRAIGLIAFGYVLLHVLTWALLDLGIKAVIAPSFSDIFSGNAFKNGLLAIVLPQAAIDRLMEVARTDDIHIDLETQTVTTPFQDRFEFEIDPFRKHCLINGVDEIGLTLKSSDAISVYEAKLSADRPWLAPNPV